MEVSDENEAAEPTESTPKEVVAERYHVEALLGEGGMSTVHRVWDELRGEQVALKRLRAQAARHKALFEREYHTLAQLAHPRIIRVLDYGVDGGAPYYTMELLQGRDLQAATAQAAPDWREICRWLRDVAAALALLHSRRLVHRDVSARNVWLSPDGRAKLIDFGGLSPMGQVDRLVGTPPFVAPEAAFGQPLDGRSDLYALGALAYLLLMRRHAYPARSIQDLRLHWQKRPMRPAVQVPELPAALSDLVMRLLSLDVRGRPGSAAEVVQRLGAIAQLPPDDSQQAALAYLTTPNMVGRDAQMLAFRKRLLRGLRGRGSALLIAAPSGAGRSRLLSGFVLEAKLMGVTTVQVRGGDSTLGTGGLLAALAEELLGISPEAAKVAGADAPALAQLSPRVREELGVSRDASGDLAERTHAILPAFVRWIERTSRKSPLLIAVDDIHHVDEMAQSALCELASLAPRRRIVLSLSAERASLAGDRPALQLLAEGCEPIELPPLDADDIAALLGSLFGEVPHLDAAVQWLQELSQGSPGHCMQYVQHLLDSGIVRYRGSEWILPERLRDHPLPADLDALLDARVRSLGDDARRLALGLCLTHDDTRPDWQPQTQLRSEHFGMLLGVEDPARVFAAVGELVRAGLLVERGGEYALSQRAIIDALLRCTSEPERRAMHLRLASVLLEGGYDDPQLALLHTQRGGDDALALARARANAFGRPNADYDWLQTRITVMIMTNERLLRFVQESGQGTPRDEVRIRSGLLLSSTVNDWSLSRYGETQLRQLGDATGLSKWDETDPELPPIDRLFACFALAQAAYDATAEDARGLSPADAVRELALCVMTLGSSYANAFDVGPLAALPAKIAPLRPLSPAIDLLARINEYTVDRAQGRDTDRFAELIANLDESSQLSTVVREGATVVLIFQHAVHAARLGRDAAAIARQIDERFHPGAWMVDYGCWLGAAFQGDAKAAAAYERRAHTTVADDVWRRRALLHVEVELYVLTDDVRGLQRVLTPIAMLAERFPGWQPVLHTARGQLHRLRGELDRARVELEHALAAAPAGKHAAYTLASPAYAWLLLEQEAFDELRAHAQASIAVAQAERLRSTTVVDNACALALGESRCGNHDAAETALSLAFECARAAGMGGLRLAVLHETRARVALAARREDIVSAAVAELGASVLPGGMASWLSRYEALFSEAGLDEEQAPAPRGGASAVERTVAQLTECFGECADPAERALRALEALVTEAGAEGGHLYLVSDGAPILVASMSDSHPSEELSRFVEQYFKAELGASETVTVTTLDLAIAQEASSATTKLDGRRYAPVILASDETADEPIGLAMLQAETDDWRRPDFSFLCALSRVLRDHAGGALTAPLAP